MPMDCSGIWGGASFDLVALDHGTFSKHDTTALGHLRIMNANRASISDMRAFISTKLKPLNWLDEMGGRPFYAVGGSLRAVARLLMNYIDYPLHVIDNFTLGREQAESLLKHSRKTQPGRPAKRPRCFKKTVGNTSRRHCPVARSHGNNQTVSFGFFWLFHARRPVLFIS